MRFYFFPFYTKIYSFNLSSHVLSLIFSEKNGKEAVLSVTKCMFLAKFRAKCEERIYPLQTGFPALHFEQNVCFVILLIGPQSSETTQGNPHILPKTPCTG